MIALHLSKVQNFAVACIGQRQWPALVQNGADWYRLRVHGAVPLHFEDDQFSKLRIRREITFNGYVGNDSRRSHKCRQALAHSF